MEMNVAAGDLVRYKMLPECLGIVLEIGETLIKVRWSEGSLVEWIPPHSLEKINVR